LENAKVEQEKLKILAEGQEKKHRAEMKRQK
jgi:hypothetical protein